MKKKNVGLLHSFSSFTIVVLLEVLALVPGASAQGSPSEAALNAAIAVQARHEEELFRYPGVVGVGVGASEYDDHVAAIVVYVDTSAGNPALPTDLEGIPVKRIDLAGPFIMKDQAPAPLHRRQYLPPPVPLGLSTGPIPGLTGTLGFRVHRIGRLDEVGYITNNHVAASSGPDNCPAQLLNPTKLPPFDLDQCQPGSLDSGGACLTKIGDLVQVIPLVQGNQFFNTVDTAFVMSERTLVSSTIQDLGKQPQRVSFVRKVGDKVCKSGRTTGLTAATVEAINMSLPVRAAVAACGIYHFVNQVVVRSLRECNPNNDFALAGDSGSPVVTCDPKCEDGTITRAKANDAVGLFFAGSGDRGAFNPLQLVLNALGVELDSERPTEPGRQR